MKIKFFSSKPYDHEFFDQLNDRHTIIYLEAHLSEKTLALAEGVDIVCCFVNDTLNRSVLQGLYKHGVKMVALRCAGFNNVDVDAAKELGIKVCRVPEYSPHAVAEHTVGLILDLNRNIHRAYNRIRENDYSLHGLMGFDLTGKTVGVIGAGKIGKAFLEIMNGFGCNCLVSDPKPLPGVENLAKLVDLDTLLEESDIISLHCPLTNDTYHLINQQSLAKMKPGVMLINTSRGGLIDTKAVIDSLKAGTLGYLGLDVYEEESDLFFEDLSDQVIQDDIFARLTTFPNVVITGHQAFFTREALHKIATTTLNNIDALERGNLDEIALIE